MYEPHPYPWVKEPVGSCCDTQEAQLGAKLCAVLCDDPEVWNEGSGWTVVQEGGDICIPMTDLLHCKQKLTQHIKQCIPIFKILLKKSMYLCSQQLCTFGIRPIMYGAKHYVQGRKCICAI